MMILAEHTRFVSRLRITGTPAIYDRSLYPGDPQAAPVPDRAVRIWKIAGIYYAVSGYDGLCSRQIIPKYVGTGTSARGAYRNLCQEYRRRHKYNYWGITAAESAFNLALLFTANRWN